MSHFHNISTILGVAETGDQITLIELILQTDPEELADDIACIVSTLLAAFSLPERNKMINKLLTGVADHDFQLLITGDDDEQND